MFESRITEWREYLDFAGTPGEADLDDLERDLRGHLATLTGAGLPTDEAFLIAVKRLAAVDAGTRRFALSRAEQLILCEPATGPEPSTDGGWHLALGFAIAAAVALQATLLAASFPEEESVWLLRNLGLLVLPFLAGYFAVRRHMPRRQMLITAAPFVVAAVVINAYPYERESQTEILVGAHLPLLLWFAVAYAYNGGRLHHRAKRSEFVRFTGEWFIFYVLIALGGGVLVGLTAGIFESVGIDTEWIPEWIVPAGAAGAVIVVAWLVESKQRLAAAVAPVLSMVFTPLFALMLTGAAVAYAIAGIGGEFDRTLLTVLDALMVVIVGLVLYGVSVEGPARRPGWLDRSRFVAVFGALVLDLMVLGSMLMRIADLGFTPNRVVALGLNIALLVNLVGSAWLAFGFLRGRRPADALHDWQMAYLPVFAIWAAVVVVVLPPVFGFS